MRGCPAGSRLGLCQWYLGAPRAGSSWRDVGVYIQSIGRASMTSLCLGSLTAQLLAGSADFLALACYFFLVACGGSVGTKGPEPGTAAPQLLMVDGQHVAS